MRKIRAVLRLKADGLSAREIGRSLHIHHTTVGDYLARAQLVRLCWPLPDDLDDAELEARLFPVPPGPPRPVPGWSYVHRELRRDGVTLMLLWLEHKREHPDGYQYTQFCNLYRAWKSELDPVLRQAYKAGEKGFVDYAGQRMPVINRKTGEVQEAQIFVGALGASNFTYVEASWTQKLPDWTASHVRMFEYWGGVPAILVPDNLKSGVKKADYYEPDLNPTYHELAEHYGAVIIPARPRHPRDRAKVEAAVQVVQRWVLAPLRNHTFFSLAELNREIARLREALNDRPFQKLEGSRRSLFEAVEKPALRPLPSTRYEFAESGKAGVNIDYHVQVDWHYYSVPYQLIGEEVQVRLTATTVEIFHRSRRVTAHARSFVRGGFTTKEEHRPKAHQQHLKWTPSRLIHWGKTIGPATGELMEMILVSRRHPEQGYRTCLGLLRLAKRFSPERLEAACQRALATGVNSYRSVKSILEHGLDQVPVEPLAQLRLPSEHANLRGPDYYASQGGNGSC